MIRWRLPRFAGGRPMWTVENRARYDRSKLRYPSDLTDEEWALVKPEIPRAKRGGNKRTVDVTARHELDAGDIEPGHRALDCPLDIFGEPAVAVQPRKGALHDPAARQQHKALGQVRPPDDLDRPIAMTVERVLQLVPGVAAIGEHVAQPGYQTACVLQQSGRTVT